MGKVKDGSSISTPAKATTKGGPAGSAKPRGNRVSSFFVNLLSADLYKPLQGRLARRGTLAGLGLVIVLGLVQLYFHLDGSSKTTQLAVPAVIGVVLGWVLFRVLEYPPFVEFLIATEAEMNKVSWTSKDELRRATLVVLATVALMAFFLFGVDFLWQFLLKLVGVLRLGDTSDFGANA